MTVLLVDANNLTMRGIHAMGRSGLSVDGVSTGPLLVVINALSRHVREERPDRVVMCWDSGASHFRKALYPDYKAQRTQSDPAVAEVKEGTFALVKEFLSLANVHQVERPGYEADDLIAWYAEWYHAAYPLPGAPGPMERRESVVILSSDKDFLQLVSEGVEQVRFASHGAPTDRWDYDRVCAEFGCVPAHLPLAMALAGDKIDGVPGVPRYGMKTAVKHLKEAQWRLEAVRDARPAVAEHWEQVETSLALVDLRHPRHEMNLRPAPRFRPTDPSSLLWDALLAFLSRYDLRSVRSRYYDGSIWGESPDGFLDRASSIT